MTDLWSAVRWGVREKEHLCVSTLHTAEKSDKGKKPGRRTRAYVECEKMRRARGSTFYMRLFVYPALDALTKKVYANALAYFHSTIGLPLAGWVSLKGEFPPSRVLRFAPGYNYRASEAQRLGRPISCFAHYQQRSKIPDSIVCCVLGAWVCVCGADWLTLRHLWEFEFSSAIVTNPANFI